MHFQSVRFNREYGWRGVVQRNVEHLQRIAHKFFCPWERSITMPTTWVCGSRCLQRGDLKRC
jgi:hypothetical protein